VRAGRGDDPIAVAARLIKEGHIVAVKGLGGFHLAVDAHNDAAVARLRRRKLREEKPLAVMARISTPSPVLHVLGRPKPSC
jgi:hydrogenase maturation factor HypF (carbamoyltransferase family)